MGVTEFSDDLFKRAYQENKIKDESKALRRKQGFTSGEYEEIKYSALNTDILKFIRIIGVPIKFREQHDPLYSPKLVYLSFVTDDNGNKCRIVWPNRNSDPDWPLYRILNKVLATKSNRASRDDDYIYSDQHPALFYRVFKNKKLRPQDLDERNLVTEQFKNSLNVYEKGWVPTQYVMMNVIDRAYMDWHKENKHTMVLSKKMSTYTGENGIERTYYEPGVPYAAYSAVMGDEVVGTYHNFTKYDIVFKKLNELPWYKAFHPENEKLFINPNFSSKDEFLKAYPFYDPEIHLRDLTDEEKSWKRYDFKKLYQVTSYSKIKRRLGVFIKNFDSAFGERIYEEVEYLSEKEKKEMVQNNDTANLEENDSLENQKSSVVVEKTFSNSDNEEKSELPTRRKKNDNDNEDTLKFDLSKFDPKKFKGLPLLSDEEKSKIINYDSDKNTFEYSESDIFKCVNDNCPMLTPESFSYCPLCGEQFN